MKSVLLKKAANNLSPNSAILIRPVQTTISKDHLPEKDEKNQVDFENVQKIQSRLASKRQ